MRLSQLKKLFDRLPEEMTRVLGRKEFPVCWYGCAAEDLQLIDEMNRADSPIGFIPSVYIYTDIRYTDAEWGGYHNLTTHSWHLDWLEKNSSTIDCARFVAFKNNIREVKVISFCHRSSWKKQFVFMIDCANQLFENAALSLKLQIDIVGERGSMEMGNGPFRLGDLGADWSFGQVPRSVFDIRGPWFSAPYSDPSTWGVPDIHDDITKSIRVLFFSDYKNADEFCLNYGCRKVHRVNLDDYKFPSEAWAEVAYHSQRAKWGGSSDKQSIILDHLTELTTKSAHYISRTNNNISLNRVSTITPDIASELVNHCGGELSFDSVKDLCYESAAILSRRIPALKFYNIAKFSASALRGLKSYSSVPKTIVDIQQVENALSILRSSWETLLESNLSAATNVLSLTGPKKRRLLVWADPKFQPPWGTWISLSKGPERREFSKMRAAVNAAIYPIEVDHIDFVHDKNHSQIKKRLRLNSRRPPVI